MNYADMKRVFKRGGVVRTVEHEIGSLTAMRHLFPIGDGRRLRVALKDAKSEVPRKHARGDELPQ